MTPIFWFVAISLVLIASALLAVFKSPLKAYRYFKTKSGKGALKGIVIFVGLALVAVLFASNARAQSLTYFNDLEVFAGLDNTLYLSPQCKREGPNNRLTSNGGFRLNVMRSTDSEKRFSAFLQYTHHSCAFNTDAEPYDSMGVHVSYKLWAR